MDEEEHEVAFHPYKDEDAQVQIDSLEKVRNERDNDQVLAALERIKADAGADRNVMPAIVEAVKAYATVGEINEKLVEVYGRYQEPIRF